MVQPTEKGLGVDPSDRVNWAQDGRVLGQR